MVTCLYSSHEVLTFGFCYETGSLLQPKLARNLLCSIDDLGLLVLLTLLLKCWAHREPSILTPLPSILVRCGQWKQEPSEAAQALGHGVTHTEHNPTWNGQFMALEFPWTCATDSTIGIRVF